MVSTNHCQLRYKNSSKNKEHFRNRVGNSTIVFQLVQSADRIFMEAYKCTRFCFDEVAIASVFFFRDIELKHRCFTNSHENCHKMSR